MNMNARVYVVQAHDGTLKLGHSRNPEARAKQIGRDVQLVHQTDVVEHAEKIERLAHRVLALHGRHIHGEWFEATLADAVAAIETAVRQAEGAELPLGLKISYQGKPLGKSKQVLVCLPKSMLDEIDNVLAKRGGQGRRSAVIREAIAKGLKHM